MSASSDPDRLEHPDVPRGRRSPAQKTDAQRLVERAVVDGERLVTDSEVLQEILHRYVAIQRREAIQPAFDAILGLVDEVLPIERADVERARTIVLGNPDLSARDSVHLAVMEHAGAERIMSFDRGYDSYPGIERLGG